MHRVLEPEIMDSERDAEEYASIDNRAVNRSFATQACALGPNARRVIDLGTGPAHIPIELASIAPQMRITAVDLADSMLELAHRNVSLAGLADRIDLRKCDVKATGLPAHAFDLVLCNSVLHHLPDPAQLLREVARLIAPGGGLLIKDLLRPGNEAELRDLVERHASTDTPYQRRLFAESLRAALTLEEVLDACRSAGLDAFTVERTSDRHFCVSGGATMEML